MRQGFRPMLEPPKHRKAVVEARRPGLCIFLTVVVVVLVFTIFGVSGWNVFVHRFDTNTQYFHTFDEVSMGEVGNDLSATFCEGYKVTMSGPGHVYLLPHSAVVNTSDVQYTPVDMRQQPFMVFNVKSAYLLTGSAVNVTACLEKGSFGPPAKVVFIKGDRNFESWRKDNECHDCVLKHVTIHENDICDRERDREAHRARLYYQVMENDKYFLVIYYGRPQQDPHMRSAGIKLHGELIHTQFDVSNAEQVCKSSSCVFELPWMSNKDVVVKFDFFPWNSFRNVTTECQARLIFWSLLFGTLPVVCVVPVMALFGVFFCRRTRRNAKALRAKHEERRQMRERMSQGKNKGPIHIITQNEDYGSVAIQDG
ncbi:unnamed protein product [Candidula unifasciata]|uniref:E3 ubiquitin-protein ligase APD1-4 middle domain-containing protein n=1 Tax=Candidula unifasciata TaxID=100452 RepID=A0A8S4A1G0_9EUPU|nr:unnamed protein product [Candidula unifasciata]